MRVTFGLESIAVWLVLAGQTAAWEFTAGLPCVLTHKAKNAEVELSYDPLQPLYSLTIRRDVPWPKGTVFALRFEGAAGLSISTDRHQLSNDGKSVRVIDRGFGNVLNGLQFNDTATAFLGDAAVVFSLEGAAGPVAGFRVCRAEAGV